MTAPATIGGLMRLARAEALAESRALRPDAPPLGIRVDLNYRFTVTCPRCGGPLRHVTNTAEPRMVGLEVGAVAECTACGDSFVVRVALVGIDHARRCRVGLDNDTALNPSVSRRPQRQGVLT